MKIVHILGRGIEGCGVTRFTLELKDWALDQGWDYTVYAPTDKKWTRASSHYLDENIKQFIIDNWDEIGLEEEDSDDNWVIINN